MSWFAMLFSAGMGIGLVFWGAAEPLSHFAINPATEQPGTDAAFRESMRFTFFHWGIHAWAIYAVVAMSLGLFPIPKRGARIDFLNIKADFWRSDERSIWHIGQCTRCLRNSRRCCNDFRISVRFKSMADYLIYSIYPISFSVQIVIIIVVTILFIASAWSGMSKGIKYLSNINMVLAVILLDSCYHSWTYFIDFQYIYRYNRTLLAKLTPYEFPRSTTR